MNNHPQFHRDQRIIQEFLPQRAGHNEMRFRIEEEQIDISDPFRPIEKEPIDTSLMQKIVLLKNDVLSFCKKLESLNIQEKLKKFKDKIFLIDASIIKNPDLDLETFQQYFTMLKSQFIEREQQLLSSVQFFKTQNQKLIQSDIQHLLENLNNFEINYQNCQPLMSLEQESDQLDIYKAVFNPTDKNYKEIIYYEKAEIPVQKYSKKQQQEKMKEQEFKNLLELLNKFYKFVALPNPQLSTVQFLEYDSRTNELNYSKYQEYQELILFVKIIFDDNQASYAIIIVQTNNNQKKCRQISQSRCRPYLKMISDALGYATDPPFYILQFNFHDAVDEFLKYVSKNLDQKTILEFLQENEEYYQRDNNNNVIIDAFDMQIQGFTPKLNFEKA